MGGKKGLTLKDANCTLGISGSPEDMRSSDRKAGGLCQRPGTPGLDLCLPGPAVIPPSSQFPLLVLPDKKNVRSYCCTAIITILLQSSFFFY